MRTRVRCIFSGRAGLNPDLGQPGQRAAAGWSLVVRGGRAGTDRRAVALVQGSEAQCPAAKGFETSNCMCTLTSVQD